jgi:hypothetical protein
MEGHESGTCVHVLVLLVNLKKWRHFVDHLVVSWP